MKKLRFAVLGAGAGGQTMAAFLTEKGYPVRLYEMCIRDRRRATTGPGLLCVHRVSEWQSPPGTGSRTAGPGYPARCGANRPLPLFLP